MNVALKYFTPQYTLHMLSTTHINLLLNQFLSYIDNLFCNVSLLGEFNTSTKCPRADQHETDMRQLITQT